jgi:hypothetical protein
LCTAAGDKASLAIAMAGQVMDHAYQGRIREASRLASEAMALIESLGDATLTVGLSFPAIYAKIESAEYFDVLRWSQRVVDLADGDPFKGNFIFGSPLALAFTSRATARYCLGRPEWRDDLRHGRSIARSADPLTYAAVVAWGYFPGIPNGALAADDRAVREIEDALRIAEQSGNDMALAFARVTLGIALVHRRTAAERPRTDAPGRGQRLFARQGHNLGDRPLVNVYLAREMARRGDREIGDLSREPRQAIIACYAVMERELGNVPDAVPQDFDTASEVLARAVEHHALHDKSAKQLGDRHTPLEETIATLNDLVRAGKVR